MWRHCGWIICFLCFEITIPFIPKRAFAQKQVDFVWLNIPDLPPARGEKVQPGLAGPVTGVAGDCLVVAGGANFPEEMPWRGGVKRYHDEIFLLKEDANETFIWIRAAEKLPCKLAYAASVTVPDAVVSIGGENASGPLSKVYFISRRGGHLRISELPDLPVPRSSGAASIIGSTVYFAGGLGPSGASSDFFCLDLEHTGGGWKMLPGLPVALSHAVAVTHKSGSGPSFLVAGGRNKTAEGTVFLSGIWEFSVSAGKWHRLADIITKGEQSGLAAGSGIVLGNRLIFFGGDEGMLFKKSESLNEAIAQSTGAAKSKFISERDSRLDHHPGFSSTIKFFDMATGNWQEESEMPSPAPVTTTAVQWKGRVFIPSGEIRPGVRTPHILAAIINQSN